MTSPLDVLSHHGVSVWLDDLSRDRLANGGLSELVSTRRVVGVTTNPSIFQAAITGSNAYDGQVAALAAGGADADAIVHALTVDVSAPVAVLLGVVTGTGGGVLRVVLVGQRPPVLVGEVYALAAVAGGASLLMMIEAGADVGVAGWVAVLVVLALRLIALRRGWSLPRFAGQG